MYPRETAGASVVYYGCALAEPSGDAPAVPEPFVLCAARLAERKGLDVLLMAFAEVAARDPSLTLALCGEDHSGGALQRFARDLGLERRVAFLGKLPHAQTLALMRRCLFFALPSRRETLGGAAIEAMQAGKAVVATRVGGLPELVRDGVEGLLVEPKDVAGLAAAMERLRSDAALRGRLGEAARRASARFSWPAAAAAYARAHDAHGGGAAAFVFWENASDQTAGALADNLARAYGDLGRRACFVTLRGSASEPFRAGRAGFPEYRVGLPGRARRPGLDALTSCAQLAWIARAQRVGVWHFFSIREIPLTGFLWYARLSGARPVVTLA